MAKQGGHEKMPSTSTFYTSSSSDSSEESGSGSTPNTPPSPAAVLTPQSMIVEPHIVKSEKVVTPPKRSPKRNTPPKGRLGAIDEHSDNISPDLPNRNPRRLLGLGAMQHSRLFQLAFPPTLYHPRPPKPLYDDIEGPNGEKLGDVRKNQKSPEPRRGAWRKLVCAGLVILMLGAIIAIILIAVLLTRKKHNAQKNSANNAPDSADIGFPTGTYAIQSYLDTTDTSCASNPATWRCYPYQTYNQSSTGSYSTLQWIIRTNSSYATSGNATYLISSSDPTFSYPFTNRPLTLENRGTADEAYTFSFPWTKTVFPTVALTSSGATTRCYFNNTILTARLFTQKPKEAALNATSMNNSTNPAWPYALDFVETIQAGPNVPTCYVYANGADGEQVNFAAASQVDGSCQCGYVNYGL